MSVVDDDIFNTFIHMYESYTSAAKDANSACSYNHMDRTSKKQ